MRRRSRQDRYGWRSDLRAYDPASSSPSGCVEQLHSASESRPLSTRIESFVDENGMMRYRASKLDCDGCALKPRCCPNAPARKILRSIHEGARDMARDIAATEAYATSRCERKKIEMLFAHLKHILKLDRLRLRGPNGACDDFDPAATAQNLRKLAKLIPVPALTEAA